MNADSISKMIANWLALNWQPLLITATVVVVYVILNTIIARLVVRADQGESRKGAALKVIKMARFITSFFGVLAILVAWGIEFQSVAIFATTTITLLGVALFASWSLLSNITAYFILLFHPSFTRGNYVRVIEADNYVEGYVSDLSFFSLELITQEGERIVYPNNLLLGRVTIVGPTDRMNSVGKIVNPATTKAKENNPEPPATN